MNKAWKKTTKRPKREPGWIEQNIVKNNNRVVDDSLDKEFGKSTRWPANWSERYFK